jgi:hypothetical protein
MKRGLANGHGGEDVPFCAVGTWQYRSISNGLVAWVCVSAVHHQTANRKEMDET